MPGFDGTGPGGMGAMTGGGRGYCAVSLGAGETELDSLKSQARALRVQLAQITAMIESMAEKGSKSTERSKK